MHSTSKIPQQKCQLPACPVLQEDAERKGPDNNATGQWGLFLRRWSMQQLSTFIVCGCTLSRRQGRKPICHQNPGGDGTSSLMTASLGDREQVRTSLEIFPSPHIPGATWGVLPALNQLQFKLSLCGNMSRPLPLRSPSGGSGRKLNVSSRPGLE